MELKEVTFRDGVYSWRCETDYEFKLYERRYAHRMGWTICGFLLLLGVLLVPKDETFIMLVLTCVILLLIVFAVSFYVMHRPGFEVIPFRMTDEYVTFREGKGKTFVSFKSVRNYEEHGNRIDLYTRRSKIPVYIPEADYEPVRDLIVSRIEEQTRFI